MVTALILSSILSGFVATTIMLLFLYLPTLWGGPMYDSLGATGSLITKQVNMRSRIIGAIILFIGGIAGAFLYGAFVIMFTQGTFPAPNYTIGTGPAAINLFFPIFGLVMGLGQGIYISMITTFIVTDFHPVQTYRTAYTLILSYLIGHMVYGVVVMVFQAQLLRLML